MNAAEWIRAAITAASAQRVIDSPYVSGGHVSGPIFWCSPYCDHVSLTVAARSRHRVGCLAFDRFAAEALDNGSVREP